MARGAEPLVAPTPAPTGDRDGRAALSAGEAAFSKASRLRTPGDFRAVFESPLLKRSSDAVLMCLAAPNELGRARLGLAISKRHVRTAVGRNRVKRAVRESFRVHLALLPGHDVVVLGRNDTAAASPADVARSAGRHWQRLCAADFKPAQRRPQKARGRRR